MVVHTSVRMWVASLIACSTVDLAKAQERLPPAPSGTAPVAPAARDATLLSQGELEEVLASIALYPDQLLANVLAASMYPDQVAAAADFVETNQDAHAIEIQGWEPPVTAIALIPQVVKMMGEYPDWVAVLGTAYSSQPQDVMHAVQSLRARAKSNGALLSNQEQQIVAQDNAIVIQPAQADVVYVPQYVPSVVYVEQYGPFASGFITFACGAWTGCFVSDLDCDWSRGRVCWGSAWKRRHSCDVNVCASVNDWRGRPRPGQEGARWGPNNARIQESGDRSTAQFRGIGDPAERFRALAAMGPKIGPTAVSRTDASRSARSTETARKLTADRARTLDVTPVVSAHSRDDTTRSGRFRSTAWGADGVGLMPSTSLTKVPRPPAPVTSEVQSRRTETTFAPSGPAKQLIGPTARPSSSSATTPSSSVSRVPTASFKPSTSGTGTGSPTASLQKGVFQSNGGSRGSSSGSGQIGPQQSPTGGKRR